MKYVSVVWIFVYCATMGIAQNAMVSKALPKWRSPVAWQQLAKKMTETQTIELLGEPCGKETVESFEVWYYQDSPKRENGQIVWRPKTGLIRFKQVVMNGQSAYLLLDWKLPAWREIAALPAEVNEPVPIIEANPPVDSVKTPVKVEINQPVVQPQTQAAPAPAPKSEPAADTSLQGIWNSVYNFFKTVPRIWLWIGGGVLLFVLYGILKPDPRYKAPRKNPDSKQPPQ